LLKLCNIWGFHGGDYEECRLLGCHAVWVKLEPRFRRNVSLLSSWWKEPVAFSSSPLMSLVS
jgi:hypothetical protein